jgi:hemolysin activation/secretion protein
VREVTSDLPGSTPRRFAAALAGALVTLLLGAVGPVGGQPPGSLLPPLVPPPLERPELPELDRLFVRGIRVVGSTVFSDEELARLTAPYVNRMVRVEELEALRVALSRLYVDRGYVNSGAILSEQVVGDGVVTYQIVEGGITGIDVTGTRWFRPGYIRRRLARAAEPPLSVNRLQDQILILLDDPRIRRLNAELSPGLRPGEGVLKVAVEERLPFRVTFGIDNYQTPSIGAERGFVILEDLNLTGNGDVLALQYGRSDGDDPVLLDFAYTLPVSASDTAVSARYRRSVGSVVEFPVLDLQSTSEIFTLGLRQPIYRTPTTEVALALTGERLAQRTTILGDPFDVPGSGSVGGESVVTALRAAVEWVWRTQERVIAARSRFSVGLDALDSTIHHDGQPDSRFFAWLGQFQFVQRLPVHDTQLLFRTDLQLASDALLPLEQLAVGGRYSVRGYRENTLIRDQAFLASVEVRVPVVRNRRWADFLEVAPFYDYGRGWNVRGDTPDPLDLSSVGVGLRWGVTIPWIVPVRSQLEIYWGYPLRNISAPGHDLQDDGLHFQLLFGSF